MSGLFDSKKTTPEVSIVADPYGDVRNKLTKWLSEKIGQPGEQYTGELVAPSTAQEKQSLTSLDQYANRTTPETTTMARNELTKTLGGEYDPASSPYYQAVKAEAARNLADTQRNISSNAAGGGRYWSGARLGQQGEAATDVNNALNTLMGQLAETERARRLQAVPLAQQMGMEEQEEPLKTATALQGLGGLERTLAQAQNDAAYNEWLRSTQEYPLNIAQLAAGVQQAPLYGEVTESPSTFMKMLGEVSPIAGSYNTAKYGYSTNQSSMSDAMNMLMKIMGMGG